MNYYNENDPKAAAWLRELIKANIIPEGIVDERSIRDVRADDLKGFTQCHFFAGIGGWAYALTLAGWPEDKRVWTGSCPCQPFSCAGKGLGEADERHLWPTFRELVREGQPPTVFGEQVASKAGREWLAGVFADLEGMGYQRAAADLCAAGVGAPHIRQRLYWVAHSQGKGRTGMESQREAEQRERARTGSGGATDRLEKPASEQRRERGGFVGGVTRASSSDVAITSGSGGLVQSNSTGRNAGQPPAASARHGDSVESAGGSCWMGEPIQQGLEGQPGNGDHGNKPRRDAAQPDGPATEASSISGVADSNGKQADAADAGGFHAQSGGRGAWSNYDIIPCRDGKSRRIESGTFPLVAGIPKGMVHSVNNGVPINPQATPEGRVARLRGYGNSIVPQLASEFIKACQD